MLTRRTHCTVCYFSFFANTTNCAGSDVRCLVLTGFFGVQMATLIWMADSNQTVTSFEFVIFCSLGCCCARCSLFSFISAAWHSWPRGHKRFSSFHTLHFDGGTPPEDGEKLIDEEEEAVVVVADFDVAPGFMAHQARLSVRASRGRTEKEDSLAVARRLESQRRRPFRHQEDHVVAWYNWL